MKMTPEMVKQLVDSIGVIAEAHKRMMDFCEKFTPIADYCMAKMQEEEKEDPKLKKLREMRREQELYELERQQERRKSRSEDDAVEDMERNRRRLEEQARSFIPASGMVFNVLQDAGKKFPGFTRGAAVSLTLVDCSDVEHSYSDDVRYVFKTDAKAEVILSERELRAMIRNRIVVFVK